ncbi:glutathione synthase [Sandaracinus amylolyticus]|uniref:Glutathione synthetase n=1 Tax=Sandaracinus amylolyticus TaxID=927083 RepID=A0A0F6WA65_9BACT|nr:glutathione synthase [Sandaracinus amylolyticus]AKF11336.1 Glutathione synthetase [Sandaracinus amylolyticus]
MRIVVLMDPVSTVLVDADTSFALMLAAQERGHRVDHALITDLFLHGWRLGARVRRATMQRDPIAPITLGDYEDVWIDEVDAVLVRKDPPFDANYLWACHLLEHVRGKTLVVNDPRALRDANEKLYATHFPSLMPATLVANDKARIKRFVTEVGGRAVLKPLSGAGGESVFLLAEGDLNVNAIIETVTQDGKRVAMAQEFLPKVTEGDKRILLLDGEPLGAILRVPQRGDVRSNIHVGGTVEKTELDAHDRAICAEVGPRCKKDGLYFVGLDVIGGKLTEVNVTSPTGIQQMSRLSGQDLSARVIEWLEQRSAS